MKGLLLIGLLGSAAWLLLRNNNSAAHRIVPAEEAAAKLQEAWSDRHAA